MWQNCSLCFYQQNCLVTAQNILAEIYGNNYPLSKTVEKGLQRLLDQRYNGRLDDFMTNFITPTETLLRRAKVEVSTGVVFFEGIQLFPSHSLPLLLLVSVFIPPVLTLRFHMASKRQTRTKATHFFKSVLHRHRFQRPQCLTQAIVTHTHSRKSRTPLEPVIIKRLKTRDRALVFMKVIP